jgi:hypothetical protein
LTEKVPTVRGRRAGADWPTDIEEAVAVEAGPKALDAEAATVPSENAHGGGEKAGY